MGSSMLCFSCTSFVLNVIYILLFLTLFRFSFSQPVCRDEERSSLLQFKESFITDYSASDEPHAYSKVAFWTNKEESRDCCMWHGVECDEITGHVISLNLSSSYLYGSLDSNSSLFNLVHLQILDLADNDFNYSQIPNAIKRLSKLTYLSLEDSFFSGQIPSEVSELSKLLQLSLCNNIDPFGKSLLELKKPIFESLTSNLTSLEELFLNNVYISSTVPKSLANLSSLTSLFLRDCHLKGEFPVDIFQLPNLQYLSVRFNEDLSGRLPLVLNQRSSLKSLLLSGTRFYGDLPSPVEKLASLTEFKASGCNFSRAILSSISKLNQLTFLDLSENNLSGTLNFDMFIILKNVTVLVLSQNKLSLIFSSWINENFPQFTVLHLSCCNLRTFPHFLMHQKNLQILSFVGNSLIGELSSAICNLSSLKVLLLSNNKLGGELPHCFGKFSKLVSIVDLSNNSFSGNIPEFTKGNQLKIINLGYNQFEGKLSKSLTHCKMLRYLNVESNKLNDIFPYWLGTLPELIILQLQKNEFRGVIEEPRTNLHFPKLRIVDISYNNFFGKLPLKYIQSWKTMRSTSLVDSNYMMTIPFQTRSTSINVNYSYYMMITPFQIRAKNSLLTYLHYLDITIAIKGIRIHYEKIQNIIAVLNLSNNKFDGEIHKIIGNLVGLHALDLSNNLLKGGIPTSLTNLTKLESLDLSQNSLLGEIPSDLDHLSFLQYFNVSYNNLSGPIPHTHLITFDSSFYEGNLGLCGILLQNLCGALEQPLPSYEEERNSPFQFGWKVVAVGYGCGFLIGWFIGKVVIARKPNWLVETFSIRG
ncbi:receptor-like protein Cf-9 [Humulus lupulus]|uniref:receptor-like protein Cf-9 n=1 Tax=Humulus lupulus TaxID=3486 RepID=UPI002B41649C|nr:receptor-like protein Cf-9 [Humulus lupulus]